MSPSRLCTRTSASAVKTTWAVAPVGALVAVSASAQVTVTRQVEFEYHATTGLVELERVDPGLSHCVETKYSFDEYGNRSKVVVRPCAGTTTSAASFATRTTELFFEARSGAYPAGAYQTRSIVRRTDGSIASEARAEYDPRFGTPTVQTEYAHKTPTKSISKTTTYDSLGRPLQESIPVHRTDAGVTTSSHVEYRRVYCLGPMAIASPASQGCITGFTASVDVSYASRMLVDPPTGESVVSASVSIVSAYFVEATPKDSAGATVGARSRVHYDSLHRQVASEQQTYSGQWSMQLTAYDALGNVALSWGPYFGRTSSGSFVAPPTELRRWTARRDELHRPLEEAFYWRESEGAAPQILRGKLEYMGLETRATTPAASSSDSSGDRVTITRKNADGHVAQVVDVDGATLNSAYDPVGNLVRKVDALNNRTEITYTPVTARFKQGMSDPGHGTWAYAYDALGQLVRQTDAKGQVTTLRYDVLGRLTAKLNGTQDGYWYYDTDTDLTNAAWCADGLNRLCVALAGKPGAPQHISRQQFQYDALARLKTQITTTMERSYQTEVGYDQLGRVARLQYPTGFAVQSTYSTASEGKIAGVLEKVVNSANTAQVFWRIESLAPANVFDAHGNLRQAVLGNGLVSVNTYDAISGKALRLRAGAAAGDYAGVQDHRYTYDKANNVATRVEAINAITESFRYDRQDRLTRYDIASSADVAANRSVLLRYDTIGNILEKTDVGAYVYGNAQRPHAVSQAGTTSFAYDANGQLERATGSQARSITWTQFNQPRCISYQGRNGTTTSDPALCEGSYQPRVTFDYDQDHKRIREVFVDGSTQRTVYMVHPDNRGGLGFEKEETRVNGSLTRTENRHYISVGGTVVAVLKTLDNSSTVPTDPNMRLFWHRDALGSVVAVSNASGSVLERMAFDPWGRRLREGGRVDPLLNPAHGDRGFTGHEHLDEVGLVHMNGRVYDPLLARFFSPDPVIQGPDMLQNFNRYSYVLNNPMKYTDPSGACFSGFIADTVACVAVGLVGTGMILQGNQYWRIVGVVLTGGTLGTNGGLVERGLVAAGATGALESVAIISGAVAGGYIGAIASRGDLEASLQGAAFGALFGAVGQSEVGLEAATGLHALIGCLQGYTSGGQCGPSAAAAAFGKYASGSINGRGPMQLVATIVVAGTASVLGGGKFANGAVQGAWGYLFNCLSTDSGNCGDPNSNVDVSGSGVADPNGKLWLPGGNAADRAVDYWVEQENPVMGTLAMLWTPDYALTTASVAGGGIGGMLRPYWRYVGEASNPASRWLTRGWSPPFGSNFSAAKEGLQLPAMPTSVIRVQVPWYQPVAGPRSVALNPQWGRGGSLEWYRGWQFPE